MQLKALIADDDAVSPVIGVILMVAITVILAAVIASFVLGLGQDANQATPQASFSFDYEQVDGNDGTSDWGVAKISHKSGDPISYQELYLRGSGFNASNGNCAGQNWARESGTTCTTPPGISSDMSTYTDSEIHVASSGNWDQGQASGSDSAVVSGDFVNVYVSSDYELDVVYQAQEGDASATLNEDSGPDA